MDAGKILLCITISALCLVLVEARGKEGSRRPIIRQPTGSATTGCYSVVLKDKITEPEMEEAMATISKLSEDSRIYSIVKKVAKAFTVKLSAYSLELVS